MPTLALNPHVLLSPVAGGYIAFDTNHEKLYDLNPIAALTIELCDGSRSPDEVADIVGPLGPSDAREAIHRWLVDAAEAGLLTVHLAPPSECSDPIGELGADELARLAARLHDQGKTQAAFLCQQRAVELCPESPRMLCDLGELAHIVGNRVAARDAYQGYLALHPGDAEIEHILTSLRDEPAPPRVADTCIKQLYQRFSTFYDSSMCDELGYQGPRQLFEVIQGSIGGRRGLSVLDLGCGTGLAGQVLRPLAARLVGVDLSAEMLSHARMRNVYDELLIGELIEWLDASRQKFDLIVACDTLIYFGDLRQVIGPARKRLNPGGSIAFSVERAAQSPFRLTDSGRYEHHLDHIRDVAGAFQMSIAEHREGFLRMEYGREVIGHFVYLAQATPPEAEPLRVGADEGLPAVAN